MYAYPCHNKVPNPQTCTAPRSSKDGPGRVGDGWKGIRSIGRESPPRRASRAREWASGGFRPAQKNTGKLITGSKATDTTGTIPWQAISGVCMHSQARVKLIWRTPLPHAKGGQGRPSRHKRALGWNRRIPPSGEIIKRRSLPSWLALVGLGVKYFPCRDCRSRLS